MLPDVQQNNPNIKIPIRKVGITKLKLPIFVKCRDNDKQHTTADVDVFIDLPANQKGIHMSRLSQHLQKTINNQLSQTSMEKIAKEIIEISEAISCQLIYRFPYFLKKSAPISKIDGITYHNVIFDLTLFKDFNKKKFYMDIENTVTSLCPCSKELGKSPSPEKFNDMGGAHNQKNLITVKCRTNDFVWIEDIVDATNKCGSCEIYSILKRPDEQSVTLTAYNNPMFCEDIARKCYIEISKIKGIEWFEVTTSSQESIHQHEATAIIDSDYM